MKTIIQLILILISINEIFGQSPCNICGGNCTPTNTINISTGYNPNINSLVPIGSIDSMWKLINNPPITGNNCNNIIFNIPNAYNVSPISQLWNQIQSAGILSSRNLADFGCNNLYNNQPWRFIRNFCVCSTVQVRIKGEMRADDEGRLTLNTPVGSSIFIKQTPPGQPADCWESTYFDTTFVLEAGCYYLEFELLNTNAVAMGFSIGGNIEALSAAANALADGNLCCQNGIISGQKILDNNSNGIIDAGDTPGSGWIISVLDANGSTVATTQTNTLGEFSFNNIPHGNYTVTETLQSGWSPSSPSNGIHTLSISQTNPFHFISFLNKRVPCCNYTTISANQTDINCCYSIIYISKDCKFSSSIITSLNNVPISLNGSPLNTQFTISNIPNDLNVQNSLGQVCVSPSSSGFSLLEIKLFAQDGSVCKDTLKLACPTPTPCCDINSIDIASPTNSLVTDYGNYYGLNFALPVSTGSNVFEEVRASIVSYEVSYDDPDCTKCYNHYSYMGTFLLQNTSANFGPLPRLGLPHYSVGSAIPGTSPVRNGVREIIWKGTPSAIGNVNPIFEILFPKPILPHCCNVKVKACMKLVFKDVNCDICEIYLCGEFDKNGFIQASSFASGGKEGAKGGIREQSAKKPLVGAEIVSVIATGGEGSGPAEKTQFDVILKSRIFTNNQGEFTIEIPKEQFKNIPDTTTIELQIKIIPPKGFDGEKDSYLVTTTIKLTEGPKFKFILGTIKSAVAGEPVPGAEIGEPNLPPIIIKTPF